MALQVVLEHGQKRVKYKPVSGLVGPPDWDLGSLDNCVVEDVTGDLILMPRCWEEEFFTSNVTPYDKLGLVDFTGLTAAFGASPGWIEHDPTGLGGGRFLMAPAGFGEIPVTATSYPANQAFHLSWFLYGEGSDFETVRCGWGGTPGDHTTGVSLRFFASCKVQVWKNGEFVGQGSIRGSGSNLQNTRIGVLLMPCRYRELLIRASTLEGFVHCFDDIAPNDTTAEITPAGAFWVHFPSGTADFQLAVFKCATTGTADSLPSAFKRPPQAGQTPTFRVFNFGGATPTVSLPGFVADGANKDHRIRVSLTGGTTTPFVRGATALFPAITADTVALSIDLMPFLVDFALAVPDDAGGVEATLTLKSPAAIEEAGAPPLRSVGNLPCDIRIGGVRIIDGRTTGAQWEEAISDETRRLTTAVRDSWKVLERTILDDPIPLDGMYFRDALKWLLEYCKLWTASTFDVPETTVKIDLAPGEEEWGTLAEAGDSVAEWIRRLIDTYAATWLYGFRPGVSGVTFYAKPPPTYGTSPKVSLYSTYEDAIGAGPEAQVRQRWIRSFSEDVLEPEANELYVTGIDPGTGRPVVRVYRDAESIDPALAPNDRPANWQGEPLTVGYYDPSLNTDDAVEDALEIMAERTTRDRRISEFVAEMLFYDAGGGVMLPVWRGDVVRIHSPNLVPATRDYVIRSLNCDRFKDIGWDTDPENNTSMVRPTTYVGEEIGSE